MHRLYQRLRLVSAALSVAFIVSSVVCLALLLIPRIDDTVPVENRLVIAFVSTAFAGAGFVVASEVFHRLEQYYYEYDEV